MPEDIIAFGCGHVIHKACLDQALLDKESSKRFHRIDEKGCPLCSGDDKFVSARPSLLL